jgi:hypothetical protein
MQPPVLVQAGGSRDEVHRREAEVMKREEQVRRRQVLFHRANEPSRPWFTSTKDLDRLRDAAAAYQQLLSTGILKSGEPVRWIYRHPEGHMLLQFADPAQVDVLAGRNPTILRATGGALQRRDGTWLIAPANGGNPPMQQQQQQQQQQSGASRALPLAPTVAHHHVSTSSPSMPPPLPHARSPQLHPSSHPSSGGPPPVRPFLGAAVHTPRFMPSDPRPMPPQHVPTRRNGPQPPPPPPPNETPRPPMQYHRYAPGHSERWSR